MTQIVRAGEADVFHTRQQHTIKVAQVGRRLAEICLKRHKPTCDAIGLNAEVIEAACLAHDLGHPPFGHIGETALDDLVVANGDPDGFEGNAQTFRILTRLAVRFTDVPGLDLTRATLAACVKYPWFRDVNNLSRAKKWGAYHHDQDDFLFATEHSGATKTPEAEIMDWADDIAYSVHDLEDFHRCGVLPWHAILNDRAGEQIVERAVGSWFGRPSDASGRLRDALRRLKDFLDVFERLLYEPYQGTRDQRSQLRTMTSGLVGLYIGALSLVPVENIGHSAGSVLIADEEADEVKVLKQITRDYIILNPALVAQQKGQRKVISDLFTMFFDDSKQKAPAYLPPRLADQWSADMTPSRYAADCIAGLTEAEAIALHARLTGASSGSVLDPIVR